jgi:hypothetical protein
MKTWLKRALFSFAPVITLTISAFPQASHSVVAWWKFDEDGGNIATDSVSGRSDNILNHHSWSKGVSGTGLKFDGFTTLIDIAPKDVPEIGSGFSIEAWIAIQSYPWNWVALVDHEDEKRAGYFFGVDAEGRLGLQVSVWGNWEICQSEERLPLQKWLHVVGTYEPIEGIRLYVDGKLVGKLSLTGSVTPAKNTGLRIGRNFVDSPPAALVRPSASFPALYSFDGIIDELKIHNRSLSSTDVARDYGLVKPPDMPDLAVRHWPSLPQPANWFGAVYTELKLYPEWDALWRTGPDSDVVVSFADSPFHYVFWRGNNYGESMVTENGIWIGDQSFESSTKIGTAEHMNDKHNLYSHISIVENSEARVVLHWRYGLADVLGNLADVDPVTGWGDWADELFYIYPDGTAVRCGTIHGTKKKYSFTEPTLLLEPGRRPEDDISVDAATIANSNGESHTYSWDPVSPPFPFPDAPSNANIALLNLKSIYKPFYIYQPGTILGPYGWPPELRPEYSHFPVWDHWPVNQIPSDGRWALFPDHYGSAAIMSPNPKNTFTDGPGPTKTTYFLFGLTTKSASALALLDRSWLKPAGVTISGGSFTQNYDARQRAYILSPKTAPGSRRKGQLELTVGASPESPIVNPAFVLQNWGDTTVRLRWNGRAVPQSSFRTGFVHRLDGTDLVIWIQREATSPFRLSVSRM